MTAPAVDTSGPAGAAAEAADWLALERVAAGDDHAFAGLVERHQQRLLRLAERMLGSVEDARDAVQEVLLKVYRKAAAVERRGQLSTWLFRVTVNHCLNQLRRRRLVTFLQLSRGADADERELDPPDGAPDAAAVLAARRRWRDTRRAIGRLPPGQRAVLVLARFEGLSYREIADVLGITLGAVESRLFRAMRSLEAQDAAARGVP